ncbi:hypothetical protein SAICODRAFT_6548 [Saitoella complicata NRRL Y-17804]|uniref:uncharacterized protein n=1 Tax=Saitoella complicata (strain BCRC 22490 / CBS 7301 / JCM 7358 / NBRC 10748 / NRRL Y-17804) TaxID=698492 RepID=UPI000867B4B0|nr:uncharacterized protein SAICODRAFT_6548 [Saitoella complicata NRRL Y-17804]ODQ54265.1 hypothetical protein SAICODRAFT_6548 [Saitoella complicata NRRL Y-17804]
MDDPWPVRKGDEGLTLDWGNVGAATIAEWREEVVEQEDHGPQVTWTHEWQFASERNQGVRYHTVGEPNTMIPATREHDDYPPLNRGIIKTSHKYLRKNQKGLWAPPETIDDDLAQSNIIQAVQSQYDPLAGELFALGRARHVKGINRYKTCVAYATGPARCDLNLAALAEVPHVFEKEVERSGLSLLMPTVANDMMPVYRFTSPIRQIVFAGDGVEYNEAPPYLAVRCHATTTIFRAVYNPATQDTKNPSFLNIVPLLEITARDTDGEQHANACFNPGYERQLAIASTSGSWAVFDIERNWNKMTKTKVGRIQLENEQGTGWKKIVWGSTLNDIIIASSRSCTLFSIPPGNDTSPKVVYEIPTKDRKRKGQKILDISSSTLSTKKNHKFIVTTSSLIWIDIDKEGSAMTLLSWKHHRDGDPSLSMAVSYLNEVYTIWIYSKANPLVTNYLFTESEDGRPRSLDAPYELLKSSLSSPRLFLQPIRAPIVSREQVETEMPDERQYLVFFSISANLAIHSQLVCTKPDTVPPVRGQRQGLRLKVAKSTRFVEDDSDDEGMDLADDEDSDVEGDVLSDDGLEYWTESTRRYDFRNVYQKVFKDTSGPEDAVRAVREVVDQARENAKKATEGDDADTGIKTLFELVHETPGVLETETLSAQLETMVHILEESGSIDIRSLATRTYGYPIPEESDEDDELDPWSAAALHKGMTEAWVRPLPVSVTDPRFRLRREREARKIAGEVALASIGVKPRGEDYRYEKSQRQRWRPLGALRQFTNMRGNVELGEDALRLARGWGKMSEHNDGEKKKDTVDLTTQEEAPPPATQSQLPNFNVVSSQVAPSSSQLAPGASQQPAKNKAVRKLQASQGFRSPARKFAATQSQAVGQSMPGFGSPAVGRSMPGFGSPAAGRSMPGLGASPALNRPAPPPGFASPVIPRTQSQMDSPARSQLAMTQVEPGRHGGRETKKRKGNKPRMEGF